VSTQFSFRARVRAIAARALAIAPLAAVVLVAVLAAPAAAQQGCDWYGSRPFCKGECPAGYVYTGQREACVTGSRRFCCPARYVTPGINCKWVGRPGSMLYVCDDPILKFFIRNTCSTPISVKVEFKPVNSAAWRTNSYRFSPGEVGYLVDTKNRFIYVTAEAIGSKRTWSRHRVDMGSRLGVSHTHALNCR
jgi:hypothetical protein